MRKFTIAPSQLRIIRFAGYCVLMAQAILLFGSKGAHGAYVVIMNAVSLVSFGGMAFYYLIGQRVVSDWQPKAVRTYFSPYIVGGWFFLLSLAVTVAGILLAR